MNQEFVDQILSNGQAGEEWLKSIPGLIDKFERQWGIKVEKPFDNLTYGYVATALRSNGQAAVLKIWFPGDEDARREAEALKIFNGEGIAKLLEVDDQEPVMLIERLSPGQPLSALEDDEQATRILASVIRNLHKPLPAVHSFASIADEYKEGIDSYKKKFGAQGPVPPTLVDKAEEVFRELVTTSKESVLVHGDLHQDNILSSERGWLAIDPKGMVAEPLYDVAAMIRNPYKALKDRPDIKEILQKRIQVLAEELGEEERRIWMWGFAQTVLSAIWNVEGPKGPEHAIFVAEAMDAIEP